MIDPYPVFKVVVRSGSGGVKESGPQRVGDFFSSKS